MKVAKSQRRRNMALVSRIIAESLEGRQLLTVALQTPVTVALSGQPAGDPTAPIFADFGGNGHQDVLVAFPSTSAIDPGFIQFGTNDGGGTFTMETPINVGIFTGKPAVGDFDGDGKIDFAVANAFGGTVSVFRRNVAGFDPVQTFATGVNPEAMAVADFNGDSHDDLAIGNRSDNTVQVRLGGTLVAILGSATTLPTAADPATLEAGLFDENNTVDLLVGASGGSGASSGALQVFKGLGDGTFNPTVVNTAGPRGVTAATDINGDGILDVVVGVTAKNKPDALINNGDGTFTLTRGSTGAIGVKAAVAGDLDEDGRADLVTASAGRIDVLPLTASGTFGKAVSFDAAGGQGAAIADVNGDGRNDVATITATPGLLSGRTLNISLGTRIGPDLTVDVLTPIPESLLTNSSATLVLRVTNHGNAALRAQTPVALYASADATIDSQDTLLLQVFPTLKIKPGQSKNVKLKVTWPPIAGTYNIIARVDGAGSTGDLNLLDNTFVVPHTVVVNEAFVDFVGTFSSVPVTVKQGGKASAILDLTTQGNINAAGKLIINFFASTDTTLEGSDTPVFTFFKKVKLVVGKATRIKIKFRMPPAVPGLYFLLADINPDQAVPESNPDNNVGVSATQISIIA